MDDMVEFISAIVIPERSRDSKIEATKQLQKRYNEALYQFSHTKMRNLFRNPVFMTLYEMHLMDEGFNAFIEQEVLYQRNPEVYKQTITKMKGMISFMIKDLGWRSVTPGDN